jgi:DNA invertase Pin-like site-specific DNA recombinase
VAYCRSFLESSDITNAKVDTISDEGVSGEIVSRPGIDEVHAGCCDRRWDVLLAEDASRLYRHETACGELIETAVDEGIRCICINDFIDTAEEDWEDRLHEAMRHHAKCNRYTSRRIKRTHTALWELGAAVGMLKPGYLRKPSVPATEREPAQGPFFDEVDSEWAPTIVEIFEWIAVGDAPQAVAERVTAAGLPKSANAKYSEWSDKNIIALIRRLDYRGLQTFRDTISKKKHRTGKRRQVANDAEEILPREMPHLRIVSDHLWNQANQAVDDRISRESTPSGTDHPLWNIPRDSRMPLSQILVCGICGERMHVIGANGYRCRNTTKRARPGMSCWNRASTKCEIAHAAIQQALLQRFVLLRDPSVQNSMIAAVDRLLENDAQTAADCEERRRQLVEKQRMLTDALENLFDIAESGTDRSDLLAARIEQSEVKLAQVTAEIEEFDENEVAPLLVKELATQIDEFHQRLQTFDRSVKSDLQHLVGTIAAVPHQQFGSNKVVLRGRFAFDPIKLLPARVRLALRQRHGDRLNELLPEVLQPVTGSVDLFEPPQFIRHRDAVVAAKQQHPQLSLKKLPGVLPFKINHMAVKRALDYHRRMEAAGVTDPYQMLEAPPENASRWKLDG